MKQSARLSRQSSFFFRNRICRSVVSWKQSVKNSSYISGALAVKRLDCLLKGV